MINNEKNGAAEQWCRSGRFGLLTARNIVYLVAIEANIRIKGEQEEVNQMKRVLSDVSYQMI